MKRLIVSVMVGLLIPLIAGAYSGNPPNGKTGAPGESTCRDCHSSYSLNSGDGHFEIETPESYLPGETYSITVRLSDPGQRRWGFQIRPYEGGECTVSDPSHTRVERVGNNWYVEHTSSGTYPGTPNGPVEWQFDWTAPDVEEVTFYAAGNAANHNNNTGGDYIYTTRATTVRDNQTAVDAAHASIYAPKYTILYDAYPNPFNPQTTLQFAVPAAQAVNLSIYDVHGQLVKTISDQTYPAGTYTIQWDGTDEQNKPLQSGVYFYRFVSDTFEQTKPIVLLK